MLAILITISQVAGDSLNLKTNVAYLFCQFLHCLVGYGIVQFLAATTHLPNE